MIVENLIFLIAFAALSVVSFITAFVGGPQKVAVNTMTGLVGLFLTGWMTLLLIIDAAVLPSAFTLPIVLFVMGTMYQALTGTFQPASWVAITGTIMAAGPFLLFQVAATQEYALGAMILCFLALFAACLMVVAFGYKLSLIGLLVPVPFLLGGSAVAVALYLSFVGSELTVLVSLLLLGGLLFAQAINGLLAGWNCDVVNMGSGMFVQMLLGAQKRPRPHRSPYVNK